MISETTTASTQQENAQQTTSSVPRTATTVPTQPHEATKSAAVNIQYPTQQQAAQSLVTNTQVTNSPLPFPLSPIAQAINLRDDACIGYDALYRKQVFSLYAVYCQFRRGSLIEQQTWRADGKKILDASGKRVRVDTSDCRILIRLTMPWLDTSNARKIELFYDDAFVNGVTPDNIGARYKLSSPQKLASQGKNNNEDNNDKPARKVLIERGQLAVVDKSLYKAAPYSLKNVMNAPAKTKTFVVLAEIDPDLSFRVSAVIEDDKLLKDAYMTFGEKYVTTDDDMANRLEKLVQKNALSIYDIRKETNDEVANKCEGLWEGTKDTTDFYKDVPEGLKEYNDLLQHGYVELLHKKGNPQEFYKKAVMKLEELKQMGVAVNKYLEREFDPTIHLDVSNLPRLLAYVETQNQTRQNEEKQRTLFKGILSEEAKKLRDKAQSV